MEIQDIQTILEFEIPENLYVPTPPLWIESKGFQGPLDLLWYLIRQQNIDILDIPVALIAAQYVQYIKLMTASRFEIAPDYLVMAVRLIQIKSQMLLPKKQEDLAEEEDPRALLIQQLTDFEDIQKTALFIDGLKRWDRDVWPICITFSSEIPPPPLPEVLLNDLVALYQDIEKKQTFKQEHEVQRPLMTLSDRMQLIFDSLPIGEKRSFWSLFTTSSPRLDVVVSFQATLELVKSQKITVHQADWSKELCLERLV